MIKSLSDINSEFRDELPDASLLAPDMPASGSNDDVKGLAASLKAVPAVSGLSRKLPRNALPIAAVIIGAILIIIALVMILNLSTPLEDDAGNVSQTQDGADAGVNADTDGEDAAQGDEYNSALDNLENEINSMRDSQEEGGSADLSDADVEAAVVGEIEIASLYLYILGLGLMEDADINTESDMRSLRKNHLAERINIHISDDLVNSDATALPADEEINSDLEFTNLTEPANTLIDAINAGRESRSFLPDVIDLREKAYSIYPLRVLKKLLAADYEELGSYYSSNKEPEAFEMYILSVKYRMEYLGELRSDSGARRTELRRVGRTFAEITEIGDLDAAIKWHAELISSCLFEMADSNAY
jgi:hypothetical protein